MNCQHCPLHQGSQKFSSAMFTGMSQQIQAIFTCNESTKPDKNKNLPEFERLCARDLWVLAFIGRNDSFAVAAAEATLDRLVLAGHSELVCHLFENAAWQTRRRLWAYMVERYPERLYLFDPLFERECLPLPASANLSEHLHIYRHYLLYGGGQGQPIAATG